MRWALIPIVLASLTIPCFAEDDIPAQQHKAGACGSDQACLHLWYNEYKKGITGEVLFWRGFENDASSQNEEGIAADLTKAYKERQYRHNHWDFPKNQQVSGVSDDDLEALTWDCRTAVTEMKYWLIGLQQEGYDQQDNDRKDYLEKVHVCEHHLHLPSFDSALR